jgi:hypothetical protein
MLNNFSWLSWLLVKYKQVVIWDSGHRIKYWLREINRNKCWTIPQSCHDYWYEQISALVYEKLEIALYTDPETVIMVKMLNNYSWLLVWTNTTGLNAEQFLMIIGMNKQVAIWVIGHQVIYLLTDINSNK